MPTPLVYMGELAVSSALLERRVHLFNQREQETGVRRSEQRLTRSGPQGKSHKPACHTLKVQCGTHMLCFPHCGDICYGTHKLKPKLK